MELPTNFLLFYFVREAKTLFLNAFLIVKVLNLEIYLCGIYLRYWKTQFPQNYYFPSMVYIGYYRNMINRIHCSNIQLFYELQISLFVCLNVE